MLIFASLKTSIIKKNFRSRAFRARLHKTGHAPPGAFQARAEHFYVRSRHTTSVGAEQRNEEVKTAVQKMSLARALNAAASTPKRYETLSSLLLNESAGFVAAFNGSLAAQLAQVVAEREAEGESGGVDADHLAGFDVVFLRHGNTGKAEVDIDRALTERGREQAVSAADFLRELPVAPLVACSSAGRRRWPSTAAPRCGANRTRRLQRRWPKGRDPACSCSKGRNFSDCRCTRSSRPRSPKC